MTLIRWTSLIPCFQSIFHKKVVLRGFQTCLRCRPLLALAQGHVHTLSLISTCTLWETRSTSHSLDPISLLPRSADFVLRVVKQERFAHYVIVERNLPVVDIVKFILPTWKSSLHRIWWCHRFWEISLNKYNNDKQVDKYVLSSAHFLFTNLWCQRCKFTACIWHPVYLEILNFEKCNIMFLGKCDFIWMDYSIYMLSK